MSIRVTCQGCGKTLNVRDEFAGKKAKCPGCAAVITIPAAALAPAAPAPARPKPPPLPPDVAPAAPPAPAAPVTPESESGAEGFAAGSGFRNGILVVAGDALWFASMDPDEVKKARKALRAGEPPAEVLGEKAERFGFDAISEVFFNEQLKDMDIRLGTGEDAKERSFRFDDQDRRDDAFDAVRRVLPEWKFSRKELTAFQAMLSPLITLGLSVMVTAFLVWLAWEMNRPLAPGESGSRRIRTNIIGIIAVYTVGWLGPVVTGLIGGLVMIAAVAWMVFRVRTPPIEVSLKSDA